MIAVSHQFHCKLKSALSSWPSSKADFVLHTSLFLIPIPDNYRSKKRRVSDHVEIEDRLESLILRVGEKSSASLESNLEGLSSVLEADLSTYKAKILKILADCAVKLPDKCTIYTTLIGKS